MSLRQYVDSWDGYVSVTDRKNVHVKTMTGGYSKTIHTYLYECNKCNWTVTKISLIPLHKAAVKHHKQQHIKL